MNRELLRLPSARSLATFLLNLSQPLSPPIPTRAIAHPKTYAEIP
ncbi:hypothetical protein [Microcoleus sp. S13_B4]